MTASLGRRWINPSASSSDSPFPIAALFPRLPPGTTIQSGTCHSEILQELERDRLLPLDAERVDRIEEIHPARLARLPGPIASPSSKSPLIWIVVAPYASAWLSFPNATFPSGMKTYAFMPAIAAYEAIDADVFPVEAHATRSIPSFLATRDADRHAAVLERARRVLPLVLEGEIVDAHPGRQGLGAVEVRVRPRAS